MDFVTGEDIVSGGQKCPNAKFLAEKCPPFDKSWPMDIIQDFADFRKTRPLDEMEGSGKIKGSSQIAPKSA